VNEDGNGDPIEAVADLTGGEAPAVEASDDAVDEGEGA
jgi:hypothetical protein